jgi:hypothetical protein
MFSRRHCWPLFCLASIRDPHNLPLRRVITMTPRVACALAFSFPFFTIQLSASDAVELAASLIDRPYVWGAEGPDAFDCSGLTQYVYRESGITLPRRAISQSQAGDPAGRRLRRGDLVFFSSDARRSLVTHVGIYEGAGMMIDASKRYGRVQRERLNDAYWLERFMFARRITEGEETPAVRVPARYPSQGGGDRSRTAVRVLEQIAEILRHRRIR